MMNKMDNLYTDLEKLRITDIRTEPSTGPRRWIFFFSAIVIIITVVGFLLFKKSLSSSNQVSIITVQTQAYGDAPTVMTAGGYIVAESEITVSSKVAGRIANLNVREGDLVHKGDIIAILDNEELRIQMEEKEANLKKATLNLKYKQELYEKDLIDLKRRKELFKENLISPSQMDQVEKNLIIAQLELDRALSELEICKKQLQLTKILFEESIIRAPITGIVINKIADVGEMLFPMKTMEGKSGSAIVTLADLRVMNVEVDINEDNIEKIKLGKPALITPDSFPDKTYQGEVAEISPMADRQKNVVPIKVRIINPDEYLKPDMSAKVTFQEKIRDEPKEKAVMRIPQNAVLNKNGKNIVFVIEDSRAIDREVQLGAIQGGYVTIEKGLKDGEKIVVEGHAHLHSNDKVSLK
ncbi:MAG: efflux RND transporter periplasmic adaptor subunit [Proteobacteria bacterium]|nr:efflux RND transporter periplasmic adaptor subunit [Pseudomonadota bacterium]